jgi:simple sugar transport system ATP-binding protein
VTKRFGAVVANRAVSISIAAGEVVALVGENGAGKSTIVNMLAGLLVPSEGRILVDGEERHFASPADSVAAGIGVVHQHFMLVPTLSALNNIVLALPDLGIGRLNREALASRVNAVAARLGFQLDPTARIDELGVAEQQRVEIVKALMHEARLLILDEPAAVLGPEDKEHLFATIRRLKAEGTAVLLITHKLEDIFAVADRAVVLRNGAVAASAAVGELSSSEIVQHMVGARDATQAGLIAASSPPSRRTAVPGEVICSIRDVTLKRPNGSVAISGLSLDLRAGEIVAVAGVDGNGQSELVRVLAGMDRPDRGTIECLSVRSEGRLWNAERLRRVGVAHVPEDRRRSGIVGSMTLARNYLLRHLDKPEFSKHALLCVGPLERAVAARIAEFQVRCTGPHDRIDHLSGGNQQKVVLAREMDGDPRLILAAHPSRGLDITTIRFVHQLLQDARDAGRAVLLVSFDLDEVLQVADRVVVFAGGRTFGPARRGEVGRAEIGAWIAGHAEAA